METPQQKINRLESEIVYLKEIQKLCKHQWNKAIYDPESGKKENIDFSAGLQGHGSDPYYQTYFTDTIIPRWSRTCEICGKKEYSYEEKVVEVKKEPKF